jgi:putative sterol carrier protein
MVRVVVEPIQAPPLLDPAAFARLVAGTSDKQLAAGLEQNRELILSEVFGRMAEHFRPERAGGVDAVVEWRIRGGPDGHDRWQTAIRGGTCEVRRNGTERPRVTLTAGPVDFIRLTTGNASGPSLFLRGRLKIRGDLLLARRIQGMFRIPRA